MKKIVLCMATALVGLTSPAYAAPLLFTFSDINNSSFQIDSNPVSTPAFIFSFTAPVTNGMQNGAAFDFGTVRFFSSGSGGGVFTEFGAVGGFGAQLFSGTTANPVISIGTFPFVDFRGSPTGSSLTVSTLGTSGAIPEPATWAMMLGGFGMMGAAVSRRQRAAFTFA